MAILRWVHTQKQLVSRDETPSVIIETGMKVQPSGYPRVWNLKGNYWRGEEEPLLLGKGLLKCCTKFHLTGRHKGKQASHQPETTRLIC